MKIAVIGGGASGMITAYLLSKSHQVSVFEKNKFLGGNIRTINKNVSSKKIASDLSLENGVIEFEHKNFQNFAKLLRHLDVSIREFDSGSQLFLTSKKNITSPSILARAKGLNNELIKSYWELLKTIPSYLKLRLRLDKIMSSDLGAHSMGLVLRDDNYSKWARMLLMYAYSTPYKYVDDMAAEIGAVTLKKYDKENRWFAISGGVYSYIEKILERSDIKVRVCANIKSILRPANKVKIVLDDGSEHVFDKLVFATTPDKVLSMLGDPSSSETRAFLPWRSYSIETFVHCDQELYKKHGARFYSEFDLFEKSQGHDAGYCGNLNQICAISPTSTTPIYFMAYNVQDQVSQELILDTQRHTTPIYSVEAVAMRSEIKLLSGKNNTYFAGAYLYDGLHEGATMSALNVSRALGGLCDLY